MQHIENLNFPKTWEHVTKSPFTVKKMILVLSVNELTLLNRIRIVPSASVSFYGLHILHNFLLESLRWKKNRDQFLSFSF